MSKKTAVHILSLILWFFLSSVVGVVSISFFEEYSVILLQYVLLISTVGVIYSAIKFVKLYNIYMIFIGMICVFLFNRIFLDIFSLYDFAQTHFLRKTHYSIPVQQEILIVFIISILFIHFGFLLSKRKYRVTEFSIKPSKIFYQLGVLIFYTYIPILLYKFFIRINIVSKYGYTSYNTIANDFNYPWFTIGAETIFLMGFSLIIASAYKKSVKKYLLLYLVVGLVTSAVGVRSLFVVKFVYVFWIYYTVYNSKKIDVKYLMIIVASIVVFAQFMGSYRSSKEFKKDNVLMSFISQQGISMNVLGHMIDNKEVFVRSGYPYILHPFVTAFIPNQGQNKAYVDKYNSLAPDLTYLLNPKAYLSGAGIASSFVPELYDLGYIFMIVGLISLGYFVGIIEYLIFYKRIWLFLSPIIISQIIYMPRTNLFPYFRQMIFFLIVFYIVQNLKTTNENRI